MISTEASRRISTFDDEPNHGLLGNWRLFAPHHCIGFYLDICFPKKRQSNVDMVQSAHNHFKNPQKKHRAEVVAYDGVFHTRIFEQIHKECYVKIERF
jgi:hypothetical protein